MRLRLPVFLLLLTMLMPLIVSAQWDAQIEEKIDKILPQLSLKEKIQLCHAQSKFSVRGVERLGIPELWMSDGPHGVRGEINWDNWGYASWTNDSITAFPALTCLAATFNPVLSHQYGEAVGEEARYRKKDVLLGPGVNIYRTPLNGRNFEYMGEDPHLASEMVVPYIKGVQKNGVAACVKHYVLNNQERWRDHINVEVSDRALYEIYLPAFKAAVQEGEAWALMGAYNQFRGQHTSHHGILLNKILKQDWAYDGVVVTDWGSAHDTREAALYGLDIEMGTGTDGLTFSKKNAYDNYFLALPFQRMIENGEIPESVLDEKVRRILRLMFRTTLNPDRGFGRKNNLEHQQVARKIAQEGIVLLKNEEAFFPIDPEREMTIAVIGENATRPMTVGGGSSELKALYEVSPLEGIQKRYKNAQIIHALGYASGPPAYGRVIPSPLDANTLKQAAIAAAKQADLVLFFGGLNKNHHQDCEGGDRLQYGLPFGQDELIEELLAVNKNLGLILISGNAIEMPWIDQVKGIMQGWFLGNETGHALADVISGDVNPSGKLPFSFPAQLEDNAAHHFGAASYPGDSINQYYKEGILVGYRWHDTKKIKPQFAFGHGLSYTTFDIRELRTPKTSYTSEEKVVLTCLVENTGTVAGKEVLQLYVGKTNSKVKRAQKELKSFKKVYLTAGSKRLHELSFKVNDLAYYNESIDDWQLEQGEYTLYLGNASDQIFGKVSIQVRE